MRGGKNSAVMVSRHTHISVCLTCIYIYSGQCNIACKLLLSVRNMFIERPHQIHKTTEDWNITLHFTCEDKVLDCIFPTKLRDPQLFE